MHLVGFHNFVQEFRPKVVLFDYPVTNLVEVGSGREVKSMLTRLIDFLKNESNHRDVHQPYLRGSHTWTNRNWASRRSWMRGWSCGTLNPAASEIARFTY